MGKKVYIRWFPATINGSAVQIAHGAREIR